MDEKNDFMKTVFNAIYVIDIIKRNIGKSGNRIHGCAKIVAHISKKRRFGFACMFGNFKGGLQNSFSAAFVQESLLVVLRTAIKTLVLSWGMRKYASL